MLNYFTCSTQCFLCRRFIYLNCFKVRLIVAHSVCLIKTWRLTLPTVQERRGGGSIKWPVPPPLAAGYFVSPAIKTRTHPLKYAGTDKCARAPPLGSARSDLREAYPGSLHFHHLANLKHAHSLSLHLHSSAIIKLLVAGDCRVMGRGAV